MKKIVPHSIYHLVLPWFFEFEKENIVCYSCTEYRYPSAEKSLFYKDPKLKIKWPIKNPIVSNKDKNAKKLEFYINNLF